MAIVFQALGTAVATTTSTLSPAWPTHQANDIALLFVTSSAGGTTQSLSSSQGFSLIDSYATGSGTAGAKLSVLWARADRSNMTAPTIAAGTDFKYAVIATFRGVSSIGSPLNTYAGNTKNTASTSASISDITTTVDNAMIINAIASDVDSASAFVTSYTNANLSSLTERFDAGTTSGLGGGISFATGMMNTAGNTGVTSVVLTSSINVFFSIALTPETSFSNTFEGGANGSSIASGNSGGASGTYLLTAIKNTGTNLTFSSTQARDSLSLCASYVVGAAGYTAWAWTTALRSVMRFYIYFDSIQDTTASFEISRFRSASATMASLSTRSKKFVVVDPSSNILATAPDLLTVGTWYRCEMAVTVGTTTSNGRVEFAYYNNNSTIPIFSYDSGATVNTGITAFDTMRLGAANGPTPDPLVMYYDDLKVQELASGFIGPSVFDYNTNQFMPFFY